jgi:hypothetical protein
MAAAMEMALDALVADVVVTCVEVSALVKGAFTLKPLMMRSLPVNVMGAATEPDRLAVVYIAALDE